MAYGRVYKIPLDNITVTTSTNQDLFEIIPGTARQVLLHAISLTSKQGATAAENVRLRLMRRTSTGSGGTSITPNELNPANNETPNVTVNHSVSSPGTAGEVLSPWFWSQQGEMLYVPTPEVRDEAVPSGDRLVLNVAEAPAASRNWCGYVAIELI